MRKRVLASLLVVLGLSLGAFSLPPFPPPSIVAVVTRVVDGDTIDVRLVSVPDGLPIRSIERIRYIGVQAPEPEEPYGPQATELNRLLVEGRTVYLELDERIRDDYGRLLAYVYLDADGYLMVNLALIATPIIGTRAYPGTTRYSTLFAAVETPVQPQGKTCADCLTALNVATEAQFDDVPGVGPAFRGVLAGTLYAVSPCTRAGIIAAINSVRTSAGTKLDTGLAEIIVWKFCPWLFCEDCGQ